MSPALAVAVLLLAAALLELALRARLTARAEHELRGPLTAFELGVERMRRLPGAAPAADALGSELERARRALADLTAARRGRRAARRAAPVALAPIVRAVAGAWDPARPVRIDWRAGDPVVGIDSGDLASALGNLVQNAAEHGEGVVELRAWRARDRVVVEVANDSPDPLRPGHARWPGGGHGLAIARRAAHDAGGRVTVVPVERGARVALELPVREV